MMWETLDFVNPINLKLGIFAGACIFLQHAAVMAFLFFVKETLIATQENLATSECKKTNFYRPW